MQDGRSQGGSFSVSADAAAAVRARWSISPAPSPGDILTPWALSDDDALAETLAADVEERRRRGLSVRLEDYLGVAPPSAPVPAVPC
jgi:hypothetical protein